MDLDEARYFDEEERNYPVLESISVVCKILAWISFLTAVLFFILVLIHIPGKIEVPGMTSAAVTVSSALLAIPILIVGAMCFVFFYALAEGIMVFLDIELNTRIAAGTAEETLEKLKRRDENVS